MKLRRLHLGAFLALFVLSGASGLAYQIVWTRLFTNALGHEVPALLGVVGAFFAGLALGGWLLEPWVVRSRNPGRCYAGLELLIGGWALAGLVLVPWADRLTAGWLGPTPSMVKHGVAAFLLPFVTLLPATLAMGGTWPAMERMAAPLRDDRRVVGALYAANTVGAVLGVVAATFIVLPRLGFASTVLMFALLNGLCAAGAWWLVGTSTESEAIPTGTPKPPPGLSMASDAPGPLAVLFVTGLLGIGYEIVGVRVLAHVLENTVYTFAGSLAVYLLGTAAGAGVYQRAWKELSYWRLRRDLLVALAAAVLVGVSLLVVIPPLYRATRDLLGSGMSGAIGAEMAVVASVFLMPTFFMGALFAHLVQSLRTAEGGVGRAVATNTAGSAVAPGLFGAALVPWLGAKWALVLVAAGYLLVAMPALRGAWRLLIVLPVAVGLVLPRQLQRPVAPPGGAVVAYREGTMDSVAVVRHADGNRSLLVNDRFTMGGTGAAVAERRHAHIPLLLHRAPRRALFLGLGTGITFAACSNHPGLEAEGVELLREVVEVWPHFAPENSFGAGAGRLRVHVADARRYVRSSRETYDVIVADLFHPARDGAGLLYTREHFDAIRMRLAGDGLFCQWLPLYQLDEPMLRTIVRTFLEVFPDGSAWLLRPNVDTPVLGLIGGRGPLRFDPDHHLARVLNGPSLEVLREVQLRNGFDLFGGFVAGAATLRQFAGSAPMNTDDHPVVMFGAPRLNYGVPMSAAGRLIGILSALTSDPRSLFSAPADGAGSRQVEELPGYIRARDLYLGALAAEQAGRSDEMIDQLAASARASESFTLSYAYGITWARQHWTTDRVRAARLFDELDRAQPARRVARELKARLEAQ